jgi:serine/threonine-protein kinase
MERRVAVKTLHAELARGGEYMERFLREAEIASRLNHPHLVAIHDFGQSEDHMLYLVMEYLDGESLGSRMKRPMRLGAALECLSQVCMALSVAHEAEIIHRDLKPDNIYLVKAAGAEVFAKVLDFGIAKMSGGAALTQTGKIFGTPQYMSPEQWRAERTVGPASDLYALGCILYEQISGFTPFDGESFMELFYQHLQSSVPDLLPRVETAGCEEMLKLLAQLLEKDAYKRPQDALEVKRQIDALLKVVPTELELPAWRPADEARRGAGLGEAATAEGAPYGMAPSARAVAASQAPGADEALLRRLGVVAVALVVLGVLGAFGAALMSGGGAPDADALAARGADLGSVDLGGAARDMAQAADSGLTPREAVDMGAALDMSAVLDMSAALDMGAVLDMGAAVKKRPRASDEVKEEALSMRSKRTIQQRIRAQQRTLKACYDLAIKRSQAAPGQYKITARLEIDGAGAVSAVEILSDPLPQASLGGCVREKIGSWTFGPSLLGARDTVTQVFEFEVKTAR